MYIQTKAIVLRTTKYGDTSVVVSMFTEKSGIRSYIIPGVRKKNARINSAFFQPLSLLEIIAQESHINKLLRLKEVRYSYNYQTIPHHIIKSTITLFLNEVLAKAIHEETVNDSLFNFIYHSLIAYDHQTEKISDFHLSFMVNLSKHLGCFPLLNPTRTSTCFHLAEGMYKPPDLNDKYLLDPTESQAFSDLFNEESSSFPIGKSKLLDILCLYFQLHLPTFGELKSRKILKEVFA